MALCRTARPSTGAASGIGSSGSGSANETLHPDWQFDRRRRDAREGLERVLAALREVAVDALDADVIIVAPRLDLGGRSIAAVFVNRDVDLAVRLIHLSGG